MKTIDAHIHMRMHQNFDRLCKECGHQNTMEHLVDTMDALDIRGCIVMGSSRSMDDPTKPGLFDLGGEVDLLNYNYPKGFGFCIGVSPEGLILNRDATIANYERAAACEGCVGFKIYLGYDHYYPYDEIFTPVYELAQRLSLTVAFHTGDTANSAGRLRFAHPLHIDDVAMRFPNLRLVICHFGNPWILDAAEVSKKNPNVFIDLSGLAVGIPETKDFYERYGGYVGVLKTWMEYLDRYDKLLYGTDWPLVNMAAYRELIASMIPENRREDVFYNNALKAYPRMSGLLR